MKSWRKGRRGRGFITSERRLAREEEKEGGGRSGHGASWYGGSGSGDGLVNCVVWGWA